ncbi:hypothetical protein CHU92_14540 [Flavobacterium cyanobacteriorum]|uniref:Carboxypeptidase-like regulatory domain-containing protein n=1 Tax=Flavobacterium cyanobacteriorum TaxID=2022802 RepID=A0A255YSA5_9FLAO|nr:carboxypeptidase-like regulatory domain-containing protein [Flavobacterium cyanobacteriorum]OYQ32092.1 hypothetical protein CHU92_14540 [Flavobacterium cyanobacteriorum]
MKGIISIVLLLLGPITMYAQQVAGLVYDNKNLPLPGAFVYLDGTTFSTDTDANGHFVLNTGDRNAGILVVSFIGYKTARIQNPFGDKSPLKIYLEEDILDIKELVINAKATFTRKQMLAAFRELFLGKSSVALSCDIENEDDILLYYDNNTYTLTAEAKKPLRIKNKKLEYDVQFDLATFGVKYRKKTLDNDDVERSVFAGTTFFKDLSENGSADKKRKKSYLGSATHLMKTIASQDWYNQGFELYVDGFRANPKEYFQVKDTLNVKKITGKVYKPSTIFVRDTLNLAAEPKKQTLMSTVRYNLLYRGSKRSVFILRDGVFYVDRFGLYSPISEVMFGGYISELKAGDMLPANYEYKE